MRRSIAVAAIAVGLVVPAVAEERFLDVAQRLHGGAAAAAWRFLWCAQDGARKVATLPAPTFAATDWVPSWARPTVEQEAAQVAQQCADDDGKFASAVPLATLAKIKAIITPRTARDIERERSALEFNMKFSPSFKLPEKR
jgi:hypothetical protein